MNTNTLTQEQYLEKTKKLFKKYLETKQYERARSQLLKIEQMEGFTKRLHKRGNITPYLPKTNVKVKNRSERRKGIQRKVVVEKAPEVTESPSIN